ncbi:MAG: preprotein translocase subunit SecE [Gammaproteobacteria bacterium]|nr:preprotein translocase subunit SecE [Gammaproteobacteria bacterium]
MSSKAETHGSKLDTVKLISALLIVICAVVGFYLYADQSLLLRVAGLLAGTALAVVVAVQTEKGRQFWLLAQEAQIEVRKVVWPTRQETVQTTLIVILMVVLVAIFLWLLDLFLGWSIRLLTGQGG